MKKSLLKITVGVFVLGLFATPSSAINPEINTKIISTNSDSWVAIENQNGIRVTCSPFELNGVSYLKIKFENTTNQAIDFSWSLNKGSEVLVNTTPSKINANSFIEADQNNLIHFNNNVSQADYSFSIHLN